MKISDWVRKLLRAFNKLGSDLSTRRFIAHNKKTFVGGNKNTRHDQPIILFELNEMHSAHIAYSYLASVLAEDERAKIVAYTTAPLLKWRHKVLHRLRKLFSAAPFGVYASFGTAEFIEPRPSNLQRSEAREIFDVILPTLADKRDVENLSIDGVWIGDLVYDTFLRMNNVPTIDLRSEAFLSHLLESIALYVYWRDYLDRHDVRALNVSHCVYNLAMPLRLAVKRNIPAFQANATHIYRLSAQNYFAYNDFIEFPQRFAHLTAYVQAAGLEYAKKSIEKRFAGEVGVHMAYSSKSAFGTTRQERLLRKSDKKKVLIATHCFFDSPHSYGNNLFPDFYEWLNFLGTVSEKSDYDWYIKTHPDYLPGTMEIVEEFVRRYPKFTLLPASSSHHQIIAEGIDVALTVYGTIGFEYAALGVPVINASLCNPHIAYKFDVHPKNIQEYEDVLMNLNDLRLQIDKREVYQYYFMRNIYNTANIFFDDYESLLVSLGGYKKQFSSRVYDAWLAEFSNLKHDEIKQALRNFIVSGDFRMDHSHFGRECSLNSLGIDA